MAEYLFPKGYPNELVEKLLGAAFTVESSFHEEDDAFVLLAEVEGSHPGHDYIMHGVHAVVFRARFAARQDSRLGRIAKRFSGGRPFPCALSSALFRCCYGGGLNGEAQPSRSY